MSDNEHSGNNSEEIIESENEIESEERDLMKFQSPIAVENVNNDNNMESNMITPIIIEDSDDLPSLDGNIGASFTNPGEKSSKYRDRLTYKLSEFQRMTNGPQLYLSPDDTIEDPMSNGVIDTQMIIDLVSADEICRGKHGKYVGWPIVDQDIMYTMFLEYSTKKFSTHMPFSINNYYEEDSLKNPAQAKAKLLKKYPITTSILLLGNGHIILAGGAATAAFMGQDSGDADFFFIGFNPGEEAQMQDLLQSVIRMLQDRADELAADIKSKFIISRSQNTVTIGYPGYFEDTAIFMMMKLQFIMRMYPETGSLLRNISLVIGGFDLYASAVAYYMDPETKLGRFCSTPAGAFALATHTNIVVTSRTSTSYVYRLMKYMKRGFRVLFSGTSKEIMARKTIEGMLNCRSGKDEFPIILPHFRYNYNQSLKDQNLGNIEVNDYGATVLDAQTFGTKLTNLSILLEGKYEQYCVVGKSWNDVVFDPKSSFLLKKENNGTINEPPKPTLKQSQKMGSKSDQEDDSEEESLEDVRIRAIENFIDSRLDSLATKHAHLGEVNPNMYHYVSIAFKRACKNMLGRFLRNKLMKENEECRLSVEALTERESMPKPEKASDRDSEEKIIQECKKKAEDLFNKYIDSMMDVYIMMQPHQFVEKCEEFKDEIIAYVSKTDEDCVLNLKNSFIINSKNPLTQQTASFNPTVVDPREWWGKDNYHNFRVGFPDDIYCILRWVFTDGPAKILGTSIFRNLLMPYFARAWAEGKTDELIKPAMNRYKNNSQFKYLKVYIKVTEPAARGYGPINTDVFITKTDNAIYDALDVGENKITRIAILPNDPDTDANVAAHNGLRHRRQRPVNRRLDMDEDDE